VTERQRVNARRETAPDPTTSTHDGRPATQWHRSASPTSLGPCRTPAGSGLPHRPRPPLCTGTAPGLPAPEKRRRPRPSVQAHRLQRPPLRLPARPPARLAHLRAPARANRPPLSRALCTAERRHAGRLEPSAPHVWPLPWHGPRPAQPHGPSACPSRAPDGCRGARAHRRRVGLTDRTVPCPSRTGGRARLRPAQLDAIALSRSCLPPGWPDGCGQVRPCGWLQARCALPRATLRLMIVPAHPGDGPPPPRRPPPRLAARCPTCGAPMRGVRRLGTATNGVGDPSGEAGRCPDERAAPRWGHPTAPGRPQPAFGLPTAAQDGSATASPRPGYAARGSSEAPVAMPHPRVRRTRPALS
jgi:hypothetical protein